MRFAFTDDQIAVRDAVRDLLAKECPPEVVRAAWPEPDADGQGPGAGARSSPERLDAVWARLAEMGVLGLLVDEAAGGLGFDEVAAALVLEETGYAAVPHPVMETVCVTAPLLAAAGRADDVAAVLAGRHVAVKPPFGLVVPGAARGGWALLLSHEVDGRRERWGALLTSLDEPAGVAASASASFTDSARDASAEAEAQVVDVETVDGSLGARTVRGCFHGFGDFPRGDVARAFDRAALGAAAQLVGLARRMLDISVAYVTERRQFGVPIGSFQAVKHHLADARLQVEFAAPAVYRAAWSLAVGADTAGRDVSMAKAMAADAAHLVGRKALQVHGGIGYTVEYDLHLFLKRAWALESLWGTTAWHRDRVARALDI